MRIAKHFVKVFKSLFFQHSCKHENVDKASCPFTGKTYTTCIDCMKRLEVRNTK